jgi:hypothetical protein
MSSTLRSALVAVTAAIALCGSSTAIAHPSIATGGVRFFHSPSRNIECEVDWKRSGVPDGAYCQTFAPVRSVTLRASGALRVCSGEGCVGNGPEDAFTLDYGRTAALGPFRCRSSETGMRCTIASGRGFELSRAGVRRLSGVVSGPKSAAAPLAGATYKPSGMWCPTNRTCFAKGVTWTSYGRNQAVGRGVAKSCAPGGIDCVTKAITVVLSAPKVACGKLRFTRLSMFGNSFEYYCLGAVFL